MRPSLLQLEHYFFARIQLTAEECVKEPGTIKVNTRAECSQHSADKTRWMVKLTVSLEPEGKTITPYTGEVEAVGFFKLTDGVAETDHKKFVIVNGQAILYGAIRELVMNLTARGPHPAYRLPLVTFIDEAIPAKRPKA